MSGLVNRPNDISLENKLITSKVQECCGREFAAKLGEFEYSILPYNLFAKPSGLLVCQCTTCCLGVQFDRIIEGHIMLKFETKYHDGALDTQSSNMKVKGLTPATSYLFLEC